MKKKTPLTLQRLRAVAACTRPKRPLVLVLDNVRSGHNVGAAFRLSDAFLLSHLYLCGITPHPPNPQLHKTALGAENTVGWTYVKTTTALLEQLKKEGYYIIAVELAEPSVPLPALQESLPKGPYALVFGHEVFGVSEEALQKADTCVEIPQHGTKFSMNVAMCMGIVVWELLRKVL